MLTYKYDETTKEFLYSEEGFLDPLESELQGTEIYIIPASSTFTPMTLEEKEGYAIVWDGNEWEYIEDHRQKYDNGGVVIEGSGTPFWRVGDSWNTKPSYMTKLGSLPEDALLEKPTKPIEVSIKDARAKIDSVTHESIIDGFDYEINGELLHFSYQEDDQQNFSDTFNAIAMKKIMGVEDLPDTIDWNGWRNHTSDYKGELVVLTLNAEMFLEIYTKGALVHKTTHLEIGKQRKQAIEIAQSVEEINTLLESWNISKIFQ